MKINLKKNAPPTVLIFRAVGGAILGQGTLEQARNLTEFARRPLYWGNQLIGMEYVDMSK
jgi:hypothetical protein